MTLKCFQYDTLSNMNTLAYITGIAGISLLGISTLPQVWRAWRKGVAGISFAGIVTALVVDTGWFIWDITNRVPAAAIADGVNVAAGAAIAYMVAKHNNIKPGVPVVSVAVLTAALIASGLINETAPGLFAFLLSLIFRTFTYTKIVRSPDITGVSTTMWILIAVSLGIWALHGYAINNAFLLVTSSITATYSLVIAATTIIKRHHQKRRTVAPIT